MMSTARLMKMLLGAASLGIAVPLSAQDAATVSPPKSATTNKASVNKSTPAAPGAKKPAAPEPEPQIPGITIPRAKGGYLGILVENGNFKLLFYDAKKKPAPVDVTRATARWPVKYKLGDERTVLNPGGDGTTLTSGTFVHPPYVFKLYLSLFVEGRDDAVESYVIDFRQ
jgi:hypothetical protein